jgi:hypothetical protein
LHGVSDARQRREVSRRERAAKKMEAALDEPVGLFPTDRPMTCKGRVRGHASRPDGVIAVPARVQHTLVQ